MHRDLHPDPPQAGELLVLEQGDDDGRLPRARRKFKRPRFLLISTLPSISDLGRGQAAVQKTERRLQLAEGPREDPQGLRGERGRAPEVREAWNPLHDVGEAEGAVLGYGGPRYR